MRSTLALIASALAGLAAVIGSLDVDSSTVPFFVGLTFLAGLQAWAAHPPFVGQRRTIARAIALVWLVASIVIGALLVMYVGVCGCSRPEPLPTVYYAGLPVTFYHLMGLYGGALLILATALGPNRWFDHSPRPGAAESPG